MFNKLDACEIFASLRFGTALVVAAVLGLAWWLATWEATESRQVDSGTIGGLELAAPTQFAPSSQNEADTAFREEDAGFSAYYRVAEPQDNMQPRLDTAEITKALLDAPDESNRVRAGQGRHVDSGSNFGIVAMPLFSAVGLGDLVPPRDITVYYDERGWIVAYLPPDQPAAGIWRPDSADGETYAHGKATEHLEQNLLVLAINEVVTIARTMAPDLADVTHTMVSYYDWQNPDCNAFVLFSNITNGGKSDTISFVIPPTITEIQASAAVLITRDSGSANSSASVKVDDNAVATASAAASLSTSKFGLRGRSGETTSLHEMSVTADNDVAAAGIVMLLYNKPGP